MYSLVVRNLHFKRRTIALLRFQPISIRRFEDVQEFSTCLLCAIVASFLQRSLIFSKISTYSLTHRTGISYLRILHLASFASDMRLTKLARFQTSKQVSTCPIPTIFGNHWRSMIRHDLSLSKKFRTSIKEERSKQMRIFQGKFQVFALLRNNFSVNALTTLKTKTKKHHVHQRRRDVMKRRISLLTTTICLRISVLALLPFKITWKMWKKKE